MTTESELMRFVVFLLHGLHADWNHEFQQQIKRKVPEKQQLFHGSDGVFIQF